MTIIAVCCSCGNKSRQNEPIFNDNQNEIELSRVDTVSIPEQARDSKDEKSPPIPISSSSSQRSHKSSNYDNMRGFDPASEDDMDDNGMSRYMENNDEEGWD